MASMLAGIWALVAGILAIVRPGITLFALAMLLGFVLVWLRVVPVLAAMRRRHAAHHSIGAATRAP